MGRPRKTKAELDRDGTFRKDRHDGPEPRLEVPPMPPDLNATEQAMWFKVTGHLEFLGVISRVDESALLLLCRQWRIYREAMEEVDRHGILIEEHTKDAYKLKENPAVRAADRAHGRMMAILQQFGMTAAARTGLKAVPTNPDPDAEAEMAALLGLN